MSGEVLGAVETAILDVDALSVDVRRLRVLVERADVRDADVTLTAHARRMDCDFITSQHCGKPIIIIIIIIRIIIIRIIIIIIIKAFIFIMYVGLLYSDSERHCGGFYALSNTIIIIIYIAPWFQMTVFNK